MDERWYCTGHWPQRGPCPQLNLVKVPYGQEKVIIWSTQFCELGQLSTPMQPPPLPRQGVFCPLKSLFSFQTSKKGLNTGRFLPLWASFASPQITKKLFFFLKKEDILPLSIFGNGGGDILVGVHVEVTWPPAESVLYYHMRLGVSEAIRLGGKHH